MVRENLFYPLLLSYFDLSPVEKRCFSHCALFPKDHVIERDDLIYLYMAQGLFSLQKNVEEESVLAERCFENLAMRSFFQDFDYGWEGYIWRCKMHDIVHDFAVFVTSNEYATLVIDDIQEKDDLSARHLTILNPSYNGPTTPLLISNKKNLQSLMFVGHDIVDNGVVGWCLGFTCLWTLILRIRSEKSIPESIGDLLHLRYLKLLRSRTDANEFRELPKTLGNLCNLQTLILENFLVPKEAAKLINLRYLRCTGEYGRLEGFTKGVGRMKNLQMLDAKLCSSAENNVNEMFQLEDLGSLNYLRELTLLGVGTDQGHVGGVTQARLHQKSYLTELHLYFGEVDHTGRDYETDKAVLEALQPPPNLEALKIFDYSGAAIPPIWMNLKHLRSLQLWFCSNCETLPPLGNLQSLESLLIVEFGKVKKVGPEFLGISGVLEEDCNSIMGQQATITLFPKLKKLSFEYMESWCEWVGIPGWNKESTKIRIMPCLECLEIKYCDQLQALPEFLETAPLKELDVSRSRRLAEEFRNNWAKTKFRHVPIIRHEENYIW